MLRAALSPCRGQASTCSSSNQGVLALSSEEWPRGMWASRACRVGPGVSQPGSDPAEQPCLSGEFAVSAAQVF